MYFPFTEHSSLANGLGPFVEGRLKGRFTVCIWGSIEGLTLKGTGLSSFQGTLGEGPKFSTDEGQLINKDQRKHKNHHFTPAIITLDSRKKHQ